MSHVIYFTRAALASVAVLALASACGGTSFSDDGDGGESGSSNNGGSKSQGGSHSTAGKATAGSSSGSGPAGGSPGGEACNAPAVSGNCEAYMEAWFHDPSTGLCRPFVYGGCGGNANNYPTFEACQAACPGGSPNYDACTAPSDCVVSTASCCGICDGAGVTARDLISYNRKFQNEVAVCAAGDVACAPCPPPPVCGDGEPCLEDPNARQFFVPQCVAGQCAVQDLRSSPVTACETADECKLRTGAACCEGCLGFGPVVAVRNDGSFEKLVCGDEPVPVAPCQACIPYPPMDAVAVCVEGHCQAAYLAATD